MIPSLTVLESEMGDLDARNQTELSVRLNSVKLGQDLSGVCCQGREDLQPAEGQESDVRFRVGAELGLSDQTDGILESLQPGRQEVSVAHVLGVVDAGKDRNGLETTRKLPLTRGCLVLRIKYSLLSGIMFACHHFPNQHIIGCDLKLSKKI